MRPLPIPRSSAAGEFSLPSKAEQQSIASFLDEKTSQIDDLIKDNEKLIELLQEKRQAIISEAVTKGLNPDVKMKDSGIEWIGEVPEEWEVKKLKHEVDLCTKKTQEKDQERSYIGLEHIQSSVGKLVKIEIQDEANVIFEEQQTDGTSTLFEVNDVLLGKLRPYLRKCIHADFNGRCTSEALVLRAKVVSSKYLFYLLLSDKFMDLVNSSTYGVKMPRASWEFIGNVLIPMPTKEEQQLICEYLDKQTEGIDSLISDIQSQIEKLKEYRQSLISEAVTGKIDVREYAKVQ